jgi:hypothetical protein
VTRFSDVPASHPFAADIAWLVERGITQGFPDGTFRPAAPVTRGQMAAFLHRFKGSPPGPRPAVPTFVDVPADHVLAASVEWLAAERITVGSASPQGQVFRPAEPVARQQMAAFLHRLSGAPAVATPSRPTFSDVAAGSAFFAAVEWLAATGVTRGSTGPDGRLRFDPTGSVTRAQMAAFLHRMDAPAPAPAPLDDVALHHLLRRTTYGVTPGLLADVAAAGGPAGWLEQQLDPARIADTEADTAMAGFPLLALAPHQVDRATTRFGWEAMFQLCAATIARATVSRRQLLEVMVELWSNHLNITCPSSDVWATRAWHDRSVVRPHALGRYEDLLVATATSPAMLRYLDGASSRGDRPNENWGRELLELHTVGRRGRLHPGRRARRGAGADRPHLLGPLERRDGGQPLGVPLPAGVALHRPGDGARVELAQRRPAGRRRRGAGPDALPGPPPRHRPADRAHARRPLRQRRPAPGAGRPAGRRVPGQRHGGRAGAAGPVRLTGVRGQRRAQDAGGRTRTSSPRCARSARAPSRTPPASPGSTSCG